MGPGGDDPGAGGKLRHPSSEQDPLRRRENGGGRPSDHRGRAERHDSGGRARPAEEIGLEGTAMIPMSAQEFKDFWHGFCGRQGVSPAVRTPRDKNIEEDPDYWAAQMSDVLTDVLTGHNQ